MLIGPARALPRCELRRCCGSSHGTDAIELMSRGDPAIEERSAQASREVRTVLDATGRPFRCRLRKIVSRRAGTIVWRAKASQRTALGDDRTRQTSVSADRRRMALASSLRAVTLAARKACAGRTGGAHRFGAIAAMAATIHPAAAHRGAPIRYSHPRWIDADSLGLDGGALSGIGLKDCTLGRRPAPASAGPSTHQSEPARPRGRRRVRGERPRGGCGRGHAEPRRATEPHHETVVLLLAEDLMLALRAAADISRRSTLSAVIRDRDERDGTCSGGRELLAGAGYSAARRSGNRIHIDEAQLTSRNAATRHCRSRKCSRQRPSQLCPQLDVTADAKERGLLIPPASWCSPPRPLSRPPLIIDRVR